MLVFFKIRLYVLMFFTSHSVFIHILLSGFLSTCSANELPLILRSDRTWQPINNQKLSRFFVNPSSPLVTIVVDLKPTDLFGVRFF